MKHKLGMQVCALALTIAGITACSGEVKEHPSTSSEFLDTPGTGLPEDKLTKVDPAPRPGQSEPPKASGAPRRATDEEVRAMRDAIARQRAKNAESPPVD